MTIDLHTVELASYFQPIISLQTRQIYGYEALGRRIQHDGSVESLGSFFQDEGITSEKRGQMDVVIVSGALDAVLRRDSHCTHPPRTSKSEAPLLFLNMHPQTVREHKNDIRSAPIIQSIIKRNMDHTRIVLEITERGWSKDSQAWVQAIQNLRAEGFLIAMDDVGAGTGTLDHVAMIRPDFVKVDRSVVQKSTRDSRYLDLFTIISLASEQIGASVLVEGVEDEEHLLQALKLGARFAQGFWFAAASPRWLPAETYQRQIDKVTGRFFQDISMRMEFTNRLEQDIETAITDWSCEQSSLTLNSSLLHALLPTLPDPCHRIFICDERGYQLSENYERDSTGKWMSQAKWRGANWSMRPYFASNRALITSQVRVTFSSAYRDYHTQKMTHTLMYRLDNNQLLLVDVHI